MCGVERKLQVPYTYKLLTVNFLQLIFTMFIELHIYAPTEMQFERKDLYTFTYS